VASFRTSIDSSLSQEEAFAYMAAFEHASEWDPSVRESRRLDDGELSTGTRFRIVSHFAGRDVPLVFEIVRYEPPRLVVLEARDPSFSARDEIAVEPAGAGSVVSYDATLDVRGVRRLLEPAMQATFARSGRAAETGLRDRLNPRP
jgi:hypothetical protein